MVFKFRSFFAAWFSVDLVVLLFVLNLHAFLVRRDESPENYCHSPGVVVGGGVVVVVVVVRRQKL